MTHRAFLLGLLAALSACSAAAQEGLVGSWTLDAQATRELPRNATMPEAQRAELFKSLATMALDMTFTDSTVTRRSSVEQAGNRYTDDESGTYRIVKRTGTTYVLAVTNGDGERRRMSVDVQGDRLVLDMDNAVTVLRRK